MLDEERIELSHEKVIFLVVGKFNCLDNMFSSELHFRSLRMMDLTLWLY